ncbi:GNAT family N-acetyltransferase [Hoyosella sp. G463]|uniref:GNAT family N-acetyltransferase n=1 Tax=Lolliginicoccus lacisalsi TaxID=2742202 RepID=A0A927PNC3_9ACTN|nr:GNAT family N-acetyltransferase [Lolliginicoccus lacisalsi]MBD8507546.1 GNAT family N-acetyltransferase [Lolliginicoccus lacisalsi]
MVNSASDRLKLEKRALGPGDAAILVEATLINLNWNEPRFSRNEVLAKPEFAHYAAVAPERGDFGIVAVEGTRWVGAVWVVFLPPEDPGYGFVDPQIGELSVCVKEAARGAGLGRELITDAIAIARNRGQRGLSLSVEDGNPARSLYERLGFMDAGGEALPGTMVLEL